jgi:hypothetical protein
MKQLRPHHHRRPMRQRLLLHHQQLSIDQLMKYQLALSKHYRQLQ